MRTASTEDVQGCVLDVPESSVTVGAFTRLLVEGGGSFFT